MEISSRGEVRRTSRYWRGWHSLRRINRQKALRHQWQDWGQGMGVCDGGRVASSPAIGEDGTVYVGSLDKKLYAINGKTGVKLWEFETGDEVDSSPAIRWDSVFRIR